MPFRILPSPPTHGTDRTAARSSEHHQNPPLTLTLMPRRDRSSPVTFRFRQRSTVKKAAAATRSASTAFGEAITGCGNVVSFSTEDCRAMSVTLRRICRMRGLHRAVTIMMLLRQLAEALSSGSGCIVPAKDTRADETDIRLERIRTYVSCNYSRHISIEEIARYIGMNRAAFCRFFRRHTGKTFTGFVNEYRISLARRMLEKKGCSVSEACYACGFNDLSYFCRSFRKSTGRCPSSVAGRSLSGR